MGVPDDDEAALDDGFAEDSLACGNLARWSGDSLRTAMRDLGALVAIFIAAARVSLVMEWTRA
jgi:hypothetical protein